jgi:hypothetical protein
VLAVFAVEGLAVGAKDVRDARDAPLYEGLEARLAESLPAGAVVLTDNRLWPALYGHAEARSLLLLFYHTNPEISRDRATDIPGALDRVAPGYVLLSPLSRDILRNLNERDASDFERYLAERAEPAGVIDYPGYGPMDLYRVRR